MIDPILICIYCGDVMNMPNEEQLEVFGYPVCCEHNMLQVEKNEIYSIIKALDVLKTHLEQELIKDF